MFTWLTSQIAEYLYAGASEATRLLRPLTPQRLRVRRAFLQAWLANRSINVRRERRRRAAARELARALGVGAFIVRPSDVARYLTPAEFAEHVKTCPTYRLAAQELTRVSASN